MLGVAEHRVRVALVQQHGKQGDGRVDVHRRHDADAAGNADVCDDVADAVLRNDGDVLAAEAGVDQAVAEAHHFLVKFFRVPVFDILLFVEFREDGGFRKLVLDAAQHVADALVVAVAQQAVGLVLAFGHV